MFGVCFGMEVQAPWPTQHPEGRIIDEGHRHITLAFLGNVSYNKVVGLLNEAPIPSFKVGITGIFDECLFLPPRHPHVVAWHVRWTEHPHAIKNYQNTLASWLRSHNFDIDDREFLPHLTIARGPFNIKKWQKSFEPLPCVATNINLYESTGNLNYVSRWKHPIRSPFDEIEHTADIAFRIHAETIHQLYTHAQMALAFRFPPILKYLSFENPVSSLDDVVIKLNEIVTNADAEEGCPFKAVSFHGDIVQEIDHTLSWEMIIDV